MENKTLEEAKKAVKATPEYKKYEEAKKAEREAWVACDVAGGDLHESLEYGDYYSADEVIEDYKKARKDYKEAKEAKEEAKEAVKATPEYKDYKEAKRATRGTPEYKADKAALAYEKSIKIYDEICKAYKEVLATEYKDTEEAEKARKTAYEAVKEAWFFARDLKQSSERLRRISEEEFL